MSRKRKTINDELEPTEKLTSDGDLLLKNLLEKQLSKETNLRKELEHKKEFVSSSEYTPISNFVSGLNSLGKFENINNHCDELEELKTAGLNTEDIDLYMGSKRGLAYLKSKHKNLDPDYITARLHHIDLILKNRLSKTQETVESSATKTSRHESEFMLSVKPNSVETALLKFALSNEKKHTVVTTAMDSIKNIERNVMNSLQYGEKLNISKIQKKARLMKNKIESMKLEVEEPKCNSLERSRSFVKNSKWDMKSTEPINDQKAETPTKIYSCEAKSNNLYTIKDGEIIKLDQSNSDYTQCTKLPIEEITKIPKFAKYDPRIPSNILFIKNLPKMSTSELENLFRAFKYQTISIKILNRRMKGQAFIELENSTVAERALCSLNGIVIKNKPLIIEFGKKQLETEDKSRT